jgi:hypothetical protein
MGRKKDKKLSKRTNRKDNYENMKEGDMKIFFDGIDKDFYNIKSVRKYL